MAAITVEWEDEQGMVRQQMADAGPTVIGRHPTCALRLYAPTVSRWHALVRRRGDGFAVWDLTDGRNPPLVNQRPIDSATRLWEGDALALGAVAMTVRRVRGITPPLAGPLLRLRWTLDSESEEETILGGDPVVIGRAPQCAIVLPSRTVAWRHATITEGGGRFIIADADGERPLRAGDRFRLGDVAIVVTAVHAGDAARTEADALPARVAAHCPTCGRTIPPALRDCPFCGPQLVGAEDSIDPRPLGRP